jgi:hypothetical protein
VTNNTEPAPNEIAAHPAMSGRPMGPEKLSQK